MRVAEAYWTAHGELASRLPARFQREGRAVAQVEARAQKKLRRLFHLSPAEQAKADLEALRDLVLLWDAGCANLGELLERFAELLKAPGGVERPVLVPFRSWQAVAWAEWRARRRVYYRAMRRYQDQPWDRQADRLCEELGALLLWEYQDLGRPLVGERALEEDKARVLALVGYVQTPGDEEGRLTLEALYWLLVRKDFLRAAEREVRKAQALLREEE